MGFFDGYNAPPLARASAIRNASNIAIKSNIARKSNIERTSALAKPVSVSRLNHLVNRLTHGPRSASQRLRSLFTRKNK